MRPLVYIDGKEGTTGLQIYDRLAGREDIQLLLIDEEKRKDVEERRRLMNQADLVFLCLPDQAACEAVSLVTNDHTRIIDASTAHRTAPGWVYGFPELRPGQREAIAQARAALDRERERAEGEKLRMGRVYQALGLSGGAFLVILLL